MEVKRLPRTTVHRYANCLVTTRTSRVRLRSGSCDSGSGCGSLFERHARESTPERVAPFG